MHILAIAPRLIPLYDPEAICTSRLLLAIANTGARIDIVTSTKDSPLDQHPGIHLHVDTDYDGESVFGKFDRWLGRYPESGFRWAKKVAPRIAEIATRADLVYSRGMPFSAHLSTYIAKEACKAFRGPWIAHFSDPWPQWPEAEFWSDKRGLRADWHAKVAARADAFTYPCERVAKVCQREQWGEAWAKQVFIVPHVASQEEPKTHQRSGNSVFQFVHTGSFYERRRPDNFMKAWCHFIKADPDRLSGFRFKHIGKTSEKIETLANERSIQETVEQTGIVSLGEAVEFQQNSDALVLIENETARESIYLPSKFIDYLWAGAPIVALSPADSTIADLLGQDYPLRADPNDADNILEILERMASRPQVLDDAVEMLKHLSNQYRPECVAKDTASFFHETIDRFHD